MEKVNDYPMKNKIVKNIFSDRPGAIGKILLLLIFFGIFLPGDSIGQIRAGFGYLKMLHGAREVSQAGTLTAALDQTYSFYANPAATGVMREWQWSATYTNWISDIYDASFLYGQKIPTLWSQWTRFVVGINYLAIPEFNNSDQLNTPVAGANLVVTGSLGQPISFVSRNLTVGASVKYFDSKLAEFKTQTTIFDLGILYRTPRFNIKKWSHGLFEYVIFSSGAALTSLGEPIKVISEKTPLPKTVRAGMAVNAGAHRGFQVNFGADYRKIRDEAGFMTFSSELCWRQLLTLRMGYSQEPNLLGNFTFGGGLQLDEQILRRYFLGRDNAIKLDLASIENNNYFASPYHGSITHQPVAPEKFRLIAPADNAIVDDDHVILQWQHTVDPDLYDDLSYRLMVDRDSTKLARTIQAERSAPDSSLQRTRNHLLLVDESVYQADFRMNDLLGGDYYWAVLALDRDHHARFAEMGGQRIARFHVTMPDPRVIAIDFDYSPWITRDDYQGKLRLTLTNSGDRIAKDFLISVYDSLAASVPSLSVIAIEESTKGLIIGQNVPSLAPGDTTVIELDWRTSWHGLHTITTKIFKSNREIDITNQNRSSFYTIPKGVFAIGDTTIVQKQYQILYDLPYVGKVFFDKGSATVQELYWRNWVIEPPLRLFARRLTEHPEIKILLQGTIDPNSGESDLQLANNRSSAVRDSLLHLGVNPEQIEVVASVALPTRSLPRNSTDARWVLEERRRVDITTDSRAEEILFQPLQTSYIEKQYLPMIFNADILSAVDLKEGRIQLESGTAQEILAIDRYLENNRLVKSLEWLFRDEDQRDPEAWLQKNITHSLHLTDALARQFMVRPQSTFLTIESIGMERRYYVLANFAQSTAFYNFYWFNLLKTVPFLLENPGTDLHFMGHGCATGPENINDVLSKKRASDFMNMFLNDVRAQFPDSFALIQQKVNPPEGFGESQPLDFRARDGSVILLGDNDTPLGRQLNRRVMIFFHTTR